MGTVTSKSLLDVPLTAIQEMMEIKRARCRKQMVEFKIVTVSQVLDVIGDGLCAYTGKEFEDRKEITFERVNPKLGYVPGNVVLVTLAANQHKSQLDSFVKGAVIPDNIKVKLLRKALYALEKKTKQTP